MFEGDHIPAKRYRRLRSFYTMQSIPFLPYGIFIQNVSFPLHVPIPPLSY